MIWTPKPCPRCGHKALTPAGMAAHAKHAPRFCEFKPGPRETWPQARARLAQWARP